MGEEQGGVTLPVPPSFVPRDRIDAPSDFGEQEDVTFELADTVEKALRLARAREQHELAYQVHRMLNRGRYAVTDLARALGLRREDLWRKQRGVVPASDEDLILRSWLMGKNRTTYPLSGLLKDPEAVKLPSFPLPTRRGRPQVGE